jgi:hypothetical protein
MGQNSKDPLMVSPHKSREEKTLPPYTDKRCMDLIT